MHSRFLARFRTSVPTGGVLLIVGIAFHRPITVLAENAGLVSRPWRVLLIGIASFLTAVLLNLILFALVRHQAAYLITASALGLTLYGLILPFRQLVLLASLTAGLVLLLASSGRGAQRTSPTSPNRLVTSASAALGAFLLVYPIPLIFPALQSTAPPTRSPVPFPDIKLEEKPDIILIVVDGYPGRKALATVLGLPDQLSRSLAERGFQVAESSWTSYSLTHLAIPSLLDMSYPVSSSIAPLGRDLRLLRAINGGENAVTAFLQKQDYRITMVESSWHGSHCASIVDECIKKPLMDDAFHAVLNMSLLYPSLNRRYGDTFTAGNLEAFATIPTIVESIGRNGKPDFAYIHLILPHPPVTFNSSCDLTSTGQQRSGFLGFPGSSRTELRNAVLDYRSQLSCTNSFILKLVARIPKDTHVLVVSDHGTDSMGQLLVAPQEWDRNMMFERFNNYVAYRPGSDSCSLDEPIIIPNIFRHILGCMTGRELPPLPDRMFVVVPDWVQGGAVLREVSPPLVEELLYPDAKGAG